MKRDTSDYLFVGIQLILLLAFTLVPNGIPLSTPFYLHYFALFIIVIGLGLMLLAFLQLNTNLTPFPSPKVNGTLIQTGIYAWIRHPIYTSILIVCLGFSMKNGSILHFVITLLLYILFYYKSKYEEKKLVSKFESYSQYAEKTGRFFPRLSQILNKN